jgi:hypothetical protein
MPRFLRRRVRDRAPRRRLRGNQEASTASTFSAGFATAIGTSAVQSFEDAVAAFVLPGQRRVTLAHANAKA